MILVTQLGLGGNIMLKNKENKIIYFFYALVLISFLYSLITLIIKGNTNAGFYWDAHDRNAFIACILGVIVINIPIAFEKIFKIRLPYILWGLYFVFLICSVFFGEVLDFYYKVPFWDVFLHFMSSIMVVIVGLIILILFTREKLNFKALPAGLTALFIFCFAVMVGSMWEIYEFSVDGLFGLNMQKFMLEDGTVLSGHAALCDTMKDIIVDTTGALLATLVVYISLKKKSSWIMKMVSKYQTKIDFVEDVKEEKA